MVWRPKAADSPQMSLLTDAPPREAAEAWLGATTHRAGCQCHRCFWAHGVIAGRIRVGFDAWRANKTSL
jgi:hypothetical protein